MTDPPPTPRSSLPNDEEEAFSSGSALLLALISWIIYWLVLRPRPAPAIATTNTTSADAGTTTSNTPRGRTPRPRPNNANANAAGVGAGVGRPGPTGAAMTGAPTSRSIQMSDAALEVLQAYPSLPPHVNTTTSSLKKHNVVGLGGSNVILSDSGLVAFSATKAARVTGTATLVAAEATPDDSDYLFMMTRQKDRAKILSRLCSSESTATPPPSKGSTLVLAISQADLGMADTISRVLYTLATFYNVIVLVAVDSTVCGDTTTTNNNNNNKNDAFTKLHAQVVGQLRSAYQSVLSEEILPSHRILLSSTTTGRVALVRQLSKVALVVDWDPSVKEQLTRFGHSVTLVDDWKSLL